MPAKYNSLSASISLGRMASPIYAILVKYVKTLLLYASVMRFIVEARRMLLAASILLLTAWRSPYVLLGGGSGCRILEDYASTDSPPSTMDSGCRAPPPLRGNYMNRAKEEPAESPMRGVDRG